MSPFSKGFLFFHQTLLGRFLTGPIVQVISIIRHDISEVRSGDGRLLRWWLIHLATSAVYFWPNQIREIFSLALSDSDLPWHLTYSGSHLLRT